MGYRAYLLRAFLQAWALELGLVPVPALILSGNELLWVTHFKLDLISGSELSRLELYKLLKLFALYSSLVYTALSCAPLCLQKAWGLGWELSPGSFGYWAYLLWAFLQARGFDPSRVPVSALNDSSESCSDLVSFKIWNSVISGSSRGRALGFETGFSAQKSPKNEEVGQNESVLSEYSVRLGELIFFVKKYRLRLKL